MDVIRTKCLKFPVFRLIAGLPDYRITSQPAIRPTISTSTSMAPAQLCPIYKIVAPFYPSVSSFFFLKR